MAWYEERFEERPRRVYQPCAWCGREMWLPPSKTGVHQRCSRECNAAWRTAEVAKRARPCVTCGAIFTPRQVQLTNGIGRYCSQRCNLAARDVLTSPEVLARAQQTARERRAAGEIVYPRGEANKQWRGGNAATRQRRKESGKEAATLRAYRKNNPHKVREFTKRRKSLKQGRLPRGTVQRIGEAQRWRCAICTVSIKRGYHLDHIMPFARGGEHVAKNVQLLCETCNVRKNSKDPTDYMRELGRLL